MRIPGVPYVQGRNRYSDPDGKKYGIAIHNTANDATARQEADYATRRTDGTSSHLYVDPTEVIQSLDTNDRAGHAGSSNGNNNALAVEITGTNGKSREWWLKNVAWEKLGKALAYVIKNDPDYSGFQVRRASVSEMKSNPKVRAFYGHNDMRLAWAGTTHTDPGDNFPWDHLFKVVNAALGSTPQEEDEMSDQTKKEVTATNERVLALAKLQDKVVTKWSSENPKGVESLPLVTALLEMRANLVALRGQDFVNEQEIVAGVLAGLGSTDLDDAATALKAAFGDRAAELGAKLQES